MKPANDTIDGRIVDYDEKTGELIIRAKYEDIGILTKRQYDKCSIPSSAGWVRVAKA